MLSYLFFWQDRLYNSTDYLKGEKKEGKALKTLIFEQLPNDSEKINSTIAILNHFLTIIAAIKVVYPSEVYNVLQLNVISKLLDEDINTKENFRDLLFNKEKDKTISRSYRIVLEEMTSALSKSKNAISESDPNNSYLLKESRKVNEILKSCLEIAAKS